MGGRGSSSGMSNKGKAYGTEYTMLHASGNIKFVEYKEGSATTPMETMTNGRVYATVNKKGELKSISYYGKNNKRYKQIDTGHSHKVDGRKIDPHTHKGYLHDEKGTRALTGKEKKMLDRVNKTWYHYNNRE